MGEAGVDLIDELIDVLNKKEEKITREEADVFLGCKNRALKGFAVGGSIATGVVWVASRRLNSFLRVYLAGGAGFIAGMWRLKESVDSSVNRILEMEGTRMQQELRKIVLEKFGNNPQRMEPFAKHFFAEEILNDSAPGNPKAVYRQRYIYAEDQQMVNRDTYRVPDASKIGMYHQQRNEDPDSLQSNRPNVGARPVRMNPMMRMAGYGDPLEVLFGYSPPEEESSKKDESDPSAKAQSRSQRRAQRRHRLRHCYRESTLEEA